MMSEERTALWAIASAIAFPIVGDRARATDLAERALAWLDDQPAAAAAPVPWLASRLVAEAVVDPPVSGRTHDARRAHLAASLRAEPVASRVAFALHVLCGYDVATTAVLCRRSTDEIEALLVPLEPATTGVEELFEPAADVAAGLEERRTGERRQADRSQGDHGEPTATPTAAQPTEERRKTNRRRWFRPRGGTVAALLLVTLAVLVVTYPGGARPSFADPPTQRSCTSSGGPGLATTIAIGASHRPARLFVPTGPSVGRPLMLLIGDGGASPEQTVATTGLESAAATEGFVLITLDGSSSPWNAGEIPTLTDDQTYAEAAVNQAGTQGCADTTRLSVVGYGTGAELAGALACDSTLHARQLVMIRGTYVPPTCTVSPPPAVLIDVDKSDDVLPVSGGWGSTTPVPGYTPSSLAVTYETWARTNRCGITSAGEAEPSGIVVSTRSGCPKGSAVVARVSTGSGHAWPSEAAGATVRFVAGR